MGALITVLGWLRGATWFGINRLTAITLVSGLLVTLYLLIISKVPLSYNLNNLKVRWKNTALTALAFTLVIGVLTLMLAFVNGMTQLTKSSGRADNVIVLSAGVTDEGFSNLGFSDVGDIANQSGVLTENDRKLASQETYLVVNQPLPNAPEGRPKRRFLQLRGIDDPQIAAKVHDVTLAPGGNWFSEAGVREGREPGNTLVECIVGEGLARTMAQDDPAMKAAGKKSLAVGDTFSLSNRTWVIAGIMESAGSLFDSEFWAKRSLVASMFGKNTYTTMMLRTESPEAASQLAEFLSKQYTKARLSARVETEYYSSLQGTNQQFLFVIWFITVFLAIGGVFGVMNTMFAAISARRKDIGVLKLMGFRSPHILASFLLESIVLGMLGGLVGVAIGSLCHGYNVSSSVSAGAGGGKTIVFQLTVDLAIWLSGLALTFAMAFFGGLFPSMNAVRLKALDVLR